MPFLKHLTKLLDIITLTQEFIRKIKEFFRDENSVERNLTNAFQKKNASVKIEEVLQEDLRHS